MCRMIGIGWSVGSSINSQAGENGPQRRSPLGHIFKVPHLENKLARQLGWAGEKCYASGAAIGCRPCIVQGASRRDGVGRVRTPTVLTILLLPRQFLAPQQH